MIFTTEDRLSIDKQKKFNELYSDDNVIELDLIKLFMGLSNIKKQSKTIELRNNYMNYGFEHTKLNLKYIKEFLSPGCKNYLIKNRQNNELFKSLKNELGLYFISKSKDNFVEAFLHLYRMFERISIMFPLLYIKHNKTFIKAFESLKSFYGNQEDQELKFLQNFQEIITKDDDIFNTYNVKIDFMFDDDEEKELRKIFNTTIYPEITSAEYEPNTLSLPFKDLSKLIIVIRNRYFHYSLKRQSNIDAINIDMNDFFKHINDHILNWIGVVYNEIIKLSI